LAKQDEEAEQLYAELEAQLQRGDRLSAAEKVLAWHDHRRGLKAPVITDSLRKYQSAR